jgi:hypothetical protein
MQVHTPFEQEDNIYFKVHIHTQLQPLFPVLMMFVLSIVRSDLIFSTI